MLSSSAVNHAELCGTVPILIYLSNDDHASPQPPAPITLQVPRSSLLLALDPYIRSELLAPAFGNQTSEYLLLTHRSSFQQAVGGSSSSSSSSPPVPLVPSYLPWQEPVGVTVDVLTSSATDCKLIASSSSSSAGGGNPISSNNQALSFVIPQSLVIAGAELISALREEFEGEDYHCANGGNANEGADANNTANNEKQRRRALLIASLLDTASYAYYAAASQIRIEEGVFPLKLTAAVTTEAPKVSRVLWLSGPRRPTAATASPASPPPAANNASSLQVPTTSSSSNNIAEAGGGGDGRKSPLNPSSAEASSAATNASASALTSTAISIPQPSNQTLLFMAQILKQSSQSLFGTVKRIVNFPPDAIDVLRRIPLIARSYSLTNAATEEQHARLQKLIAMKKGGGNGTLSPPPPLSSPTNDFFLQQQLITPQQILSKSMGTSDVVEAVNQGKFTSVGSALSWMGEQRSKMEGIGGVCEGIPIVLHWVAESATATATTLPSYTPLFASTAVTIPNPLRGSSFSGAMSSREGGGGAFWAGTDSVATASGGSGSSSAMNASMTSTVGGQSYFTMEDAVRYALATACASQFGIGTWLDGDRRKAASKVEVPKHASIQPPTSTAGGGGDGGNDGPNPQHYKAAVPQPIPRKVLTALLSTLSVAAGGDAILRQKKAKKEEEKKKGYGDDDDDTENSPTTGGNSTTAAGTTPNFTSFVSTASSDSASPTNAGGILTASFSAAAGGASSSSLRLLSSIPLGLQWLNAYLINTYKLSAVTTSNYCDEEGLEQRRVASLREAFERHASLYSEACAVVKAMRVSGSLFAVPPASPSSSTSPSSAAALVKKALASVATTTAAAAANAPNTAAAEASSPTSSSSSSSSSIVCDSFVAVSKEAEMLQLIRALLIVETMQLMRWKESVLELSEVSASFETSSSAAQPLPLPPMPRLDLIEALLTGGGSDDGHQLSSLSPSPSPSSSLPLPLIHAALPRILINGVEPSPSTPFLHAYEAMGGGDMRLHITIVVPRGLRPLM